MSEIAVESNILVKEIQETYRPNITVGGDDRNNHLYYRLKECFRKAQSIDIIVSFLMESGVKMIINDLKQALDRGVKVRILSGNYLNITQPSALYLLKEKLDDRAEIAFYNNKSRSFHPKSYIFRYEDEGEIFVGSSNISRGALTSSIEWNYRLTKNSNAEDFAYFEESFNDLYNNHSIMVTDEVLDNYAKTWIRPNVYKDMQKQEEENEVVDLFEPRGVQIEMLYALEQNRNDGFDKALVVAATGIGKTYLSAFDSLKYKRVLFVAHREEIIKQAMQSFKNVRPNSKSGLFYANNKETENDLVFALVQTLGKKEYLNEEYFSKDYFDYIIIDEFHHAAAGNYKNIIDYFTPKFMLGLTATPERLDGKDVFAICDYNIAYEFRLKEAINRGVLVPFKYYGIYDETVNYEKIERKNGKYDSKMLDDAIIISKRDDLIIKNYNKYPSKSAIGFCASKKHAEHMAKSFNEAGILAVAVYSGEKGEFSEDREEALNKLRKGEIKVIFSVDMFNEGLDVPSIDLVMFLRPTESPSIFLQQLGRGLRKCKGKDKLIVLDFIGNYERANLAPFLLSSSEYSKQKAKGTKISEYEYPVDCDVDFDFRLVDIFEKIAKAQYKIVDLILEEFMRISDESKSTPSRVDVFRQMDENIYLEMKSNTKYNIFKDYISYLEQNNMLTEEEKIIKNSRAYDFIKVIESTAMSKSYKIPLLLAFLNNGEIKIKINDDDLYESFKTFYNKGSNKVDMKKDNSTKNFEAWSQKEFVNLARKNPVKAMCSSHSDFFSIDTENNVCISGIDEFINNKEFIKHFDDAIRFRMEQYYRNRYDKKQSKEN